MTDRISGFCPRHQKSVKRSPSISKIGPISYCAPALLRDQDEISQTKQLSDILTSRRCFKTAKAAMKNNYEDQRGVGTSATCVIIS